MSHRKTEFLAPRGGISEEKEDVEMNEHEARVNPMELAVAIAHEHAKKGWTAGATEANRTALRLAIQDALSIAYLSGVGQGSVLERQWIVSAIANIAFKAGGPYSGKARAGAYSAGLSAAMTAVIETINAVPKVSPPPVAEEG